MTFLRLVSVGVAFLLASGCGDGETSPESALRQAIDRVVQAAEEGSVSEAAAVLHPGYRDNRHPDKRSAKASLLWYLRRHRSIHVFTMTRDVRVDASATSASTETLVAMAGVPMESLQSVISVNADLYRFDVEWRLEDGQWLAIQSNWQRVDPTQL